MSNLADRAAFDEIVRSLGQEYFRRDVMPPDSVELRARTDVPFAQLRRQVEHQVVVRTLIEQGRDWSHYAQELEVASPRGSGSAWHRLGEQRSLSEPTIEHVQPEIRSFVGFSRLYRLLWVFMSIICFGWGAVLSASAAGFVGVGPSTLAAGSVATAGLVATLVVAGRRSAVPDER